jgi:hypothetical protein
MATAGRLLTNAQPGLVIAWQANSGFGIAGMDASRRMSNIVHHLREICLLHPIFI